MRNHFVFCTITGVHTTDNELNEDAASENNCEIKIMNVYRNCIDVYAKVGPGSKADAGPNLRPKKMRSLKNIEWK